MNVDIDKIAAGADMIRRDIRTALILLRETQKILFEGEAGSSEAAMGKIKEAIEVLEQ